MDQTYMKTKNILPLLTSMALPMMLSMLVNSMYNIIDSLFVAKISERSMTALSLVYPMQNLILAVLVGFGIGINCAVAYQLGAKNQKKADTCAAIGMILNLLHGVMLMAAGLIFMPDFLRLFTEDTLVLDMGIQYSNIVLLFTIPNSIAISYEKIFQSVGRMTVSMISMMVGCITNIILDPILIFGVGIFPEMGMRGAALATGIGQSVTLLFYLVFYLKTPISVKLRLDRHILNKAMIGNLYGIGIPAALNMALPSLLISVLNSILSAFSAVCVLVLGVYYKLQTFIYLSANGIVQGMRPIVGYNFGAGEYQRVKKINQTGLLLILCIMLLGMILCLRVPSELMSLFTKNGQTIAIGVQAIRIISLGFLASGVSVTISGTLEGLGMGFPSLMISLCRYTIFIIPIAFLLSRRMGADGVWYAFFISECMTMLVSWIIYRKISRNKL